MQLAAQFFLLHLVISCLLILTDNRSALAYKKNQGEDKVSLCFQGSGQTSQTLCDQQYCQAQDIPGKLNVGADTLLRSVPTPTEWQLHPTVCQTLFNIWDRSLVDLFATTWNEKLLIFVSILRQSGSGNRCIINMLGRNDGVSFSTDSPAFPDNIKDEGRRCTFILIAPNWPSQLWFPELLFLLIDVSRSLPNWDYLLTQSQGQVRYLCPQLFRLHGWLLSNDPSRRKVF